MTSITCQFSREEIEAGDFSCFIKEWPLHALPQGGSLRKYLNRFVFHVQGFESDPREVYEIPVVRRFFRSFNSEWPFWFFACDLSAPGLQIMTLCCLPRLSILRRRSADFCQVEFDTADLQTFVLDGFRGMNFLFKQAGRSQVENFQRSVQIIEYFQTEGRFDLSTAR